MTHNVNLGVGNYAEDGTTGMFYHAPAGTALPTYPGETLASAWVEVGAISVDGITFTSNKTSDNLKNWANKIERLLPGEDAGQVGAPIIYTTEESLKTIFGADHVTVTAATATHGKLVTVDFKQGDTSDEEAFLFLMKDGDDMIMLGTKKGFVSELGDVAFQPNEAINWDATITADHWVLVKDDGQKTS